jgi:hypothetical protein
MKIFVAYGYNDRDRWIPDLVFPLVRAFGDEVVTGEELAGEVITDGVRAQIRRSDALIAFATRRGDPNNERWATHRWVTDELAHALAIPLPVLEVRESGVDDQGGMAGDRQRVVYEEGRRDVCLVEVAKALGRWHSTNHVRLQLLPDECTEQILPFLRDSSLRCTYRVLVEGDVSPEVRADILPITGGLFVQARNIPRQALIQLNVECRGQSWSSDFESTDSLGVRLRQD